MHAIVSRKKRASETLISLKSQQLRNSSLMLRPSRTLSVFIVALLCIGAFERTSCQFEKEADSSQTLGRLEKAIDFLVSCQFDADVGLCAEVYNSPNRTFWLVSDNLWAWKALSLSNASGLNGANEAGRIAGIIEMQLKEYVASYNLPSKQGMPASYMHEAVIENNTIETPTEMQQP
jgi:hypothetical protein